VPTKRRTSVPTGGAQIRSFGSGPLRGRNGVPRSREVELRSASSRRWGRAGTGLGGSSGSGGPGADAGDLVDVDADDVAGGRVVHGREPDVGAEVRVGESLQQCGGAAGGETGPAVDDHVVVETDGVAALGLDRQ